jgi:hypothetical protein
MGRVYSRPGVQPGAALATPSPVIPEIPAYLKGHKDPEQRAVEFEARSQGQKNAWAERPRGKRRVYGVKEGVELLRRRGGGTVDVPEATITLTPPTRTPPPDLNQPVDVPTLLRLQQQGVSGLMPHHQTPGEEIMPKPKYERAARSKKDEKLAKDLKDILSAATAELPDEQIATALSQRGHRGEGESWSSFLKRVRTVGREYGLEGDFGWATPSAGPPGSRKQNTGGSARVFRVMEGDATSLSLGDGQTMSDAQAEEIVAGMERAGRGWQASPRHDQAAMLSAVEMARPGGLTAEQAQQVVEEFERVCRTGR